MNQIFGNALLSLLISGISVVSCAAAIAAEVQVETESAQSQNPSVQLSNAQTVAPVTTSQIPVLGSNATLPQEVNRVAYEQKDSLGQVTSVSQLSDVQPTDWAFQALQSLVERYGCIAGYPDGTYRGNRALTRYEFAAGLNACLDRVNELITAATSDLVTREDLGTLQRLQEEFAAELATLRGRVDSLEAVTAELESNQFSTTTKLNGEVIFAPSDTFGEDVDDNTVFQSRARLNFDTSFTGTDQLRARLQAGNFDTFGFFGEITNEGQLAYGTDTDNEVVLNDLFYNFRIGEKLSVYLLANSGEFDDVVTAVDTLLTATGTGAVSNFSFNPIYNAGGQNAGLIFDYNLTDALKVTGGYLSGEASSPDEGQGLFNGDYSVLGRLEYGTEAFQVAAVYVHSYAQFLNTNEQGSIRSQLIVADDNGEATPVVGNHYGLEASLQVSPGFRISAWGGLSDAIVIGTGDADIWNYAVTLDFPDFGKEGSLLSFIVGVEPYLAGTTGFTVVDGQDQARRDDPDIGLHVEAIYRYQLTDNISITPGVIWLTAPGHNDDNNDIVVGTVRTTFQF